jgi:hypothetical protein
MRLAIYCALEPNKTIGHSLDVFVCKVGYKFHPVPVIASIRLWQQQQLDAVLLGLARRR